MDLYTECLSQDGLASYAAGECGMKQDPVRYVITLLTSSLFSLVEALTGTNLRDGLMIRETSPSLAGMGTRARTMSIWKWDEG